MKRKNIIAFAAALAMISGNIYGTSLFNTDTVSAMGFASYDLSVTLEDYTIKIPEGCSLNSDCLLNNGISIVDYVGFCHDYEGDPEYGTISKDGKTQEVSIYDCDVEYPEVVKEGKNTIKFSYAFPNELYTSSTELEVNVEYCDEDEAENKPPVDTDKIVIFGMTYSVVQPGETTYVDINISENAGFVAMMLKLLYDENVFTLESISAMPEFTGNEYHFDYNLNTNRLIFMNDCSDNFNVMGRSIIRLAFKVKDDAPEGDYTIGMEKGDNVGIVALNSRREQYTPNVEFTTGTITVNKQEDPKTYVSSMPLGRVYANMGDSQPSSKTGDLTGDGTINALDALKLTKYLLGTSSAANNGDTNEDGKINIIDYMKLKTYIIGG